MVAVELQCDPSGHIDACHMDGDFFVEGGDAGRARSLIHRIEQRLAAGLPIGQVLSGDSRIRLIGTDARYIELAYNRALEQARKALGTGVSAQLIQWSKATEDTRKPARRPSPPESVEVDYRRRWRSLRLRLVHDRPRQPQEQMDLDEAWARQLAAGQRPASLRIWEWQSPAVVIGHFQSIQAQVNEEAAAQLGMSVVRRCTGGGSMFIQPGNTITYSLYAPLEFVRGVGIEESYRLCDQWLLDALRDLGMEVRFSGLNDIGSSAGKIGGAAQRRFPPVAGGPGSVLHHVTMAYDIDAQAMGRVLRISQEKLSDKSVASASKRVDPLRSQTHMSREAIIEHLLASAAGRAVGG
ncbi:ligase [Bifidobacterium aemilianum]|uniref:Ligase n=1 Tax=Bifidobacterium aemilianum TaxID=2493120 RepID=A0A366K6X4_9BIFI|nr:lipoate--protein ligase family protein [Bifidobacterium aemilianum]RBP97500.1 ligase [Bifidobacterium aemilianum]